MPDWDYIIAGGGTAGAVLAARLTENPDVNVLVLEAGPDYRAALTPPALLDRSLGQELSPEPRMAITEPDLYYLGIMARRTPQQEVRPYLRGRGIGGSSTVNGLCAIRGVPEDFAEWSRLGAVGWDYADILPAFCKSETDAQFPDSEWHGGSGPIPVHREPESGWGGLDIAVRDAALDEGHGWHPDHNAPDSTGASIFAINARDGKRVAANHGYIEPARGRANLTIVGGALVDVVLIENEQAVGVRLADGTEYRVAAGGEVLVCGGAIHSPAILMRSGIGPEAELRRLGVAANAILPVGQGIQDHVIVAVDLPVQPEAKLCAGNRPTYVVVRYSSGVADSRANDVMLLANNHNYWFGLESAGIAVQLNQVFSRGTLTLPSADPATDPYLEMNLLSDPRDFAKLKDGLERLRPFFEHPSMKRIALGAPAFPEDDAAIRRAAKDVVHICGSAPMGQPGDPAAVVDPECRLLGIGGLRVIDASIMPTAVSANLCLTVFAIGELMAARLTGSPLRARP